MCQNGTSVAMGAHASLFTRARGALPTSFFLTMIAAVNLAMAFVPPVSNHRALLVPMYRAAQPDMVLGGLLAVSAASVLASGLKLVGTGESQLIERLGKYDRELPPGFHVCIPLVERTSFRCTTREQVLDIPPQKAITRDNAPLTADAVVYWKIVDVRLARYAVKDLVDAIQNLVLTQLRSEIGKLTLDVRRHTASKGRREKHILSLSLPSLSHQFPSAKSLVESPPLSRARARCSSRAGDLLGTAEDECDPP